MRSRYWSIGAMAALVLFLVSCAQVEHARTLRSWNGTALGHAYVGSCGLHLLVNGRPVAGVWRWPASITLDARRCAGDERTRRTLAHEVAHLVRCGPNEACARRYARELLAGGVTLADLGWPD